MESDWYFDENGSPVGPTTSSYIAQLARLQPDVLVWKAGMDGWTAIRNLPEFSELVRSAPPPLPVRTIAVPPPDQGESSADVSLVRPWRRLFSRSLDYLFHIYFMFFATFGVGRLIAARDPQDKAAFYFFSHPFRGTLIFFMSFIPIEILMLWLFKRSLGKMIYNTRLRELSFRKSARRSVLVWWRGLATGFPLFPLVSGVTAYRYLKRNGVTTWDRDLNIHVEHGRIPFWLWLIILIVWMIFLSPIVALVVAIIRAILG